MIVRARKQEDGVELGMSHMWMEYPVFHKPASLPSAARRCLPQKGISQVDPDPSLDADVIRVASALALAVAWGVQGCACGLDPSRLAK